MTSSEATTSRTLDVPGARLHCDLRGSGPLLLLIPGGAADGGAFARLAPLLATDHTVVTYDPRGLGKSTRDEPGAEVTVETQADDAHRLIASLTTGTTGPVDVLGSSGGATTGLELVRRHPEQVRTLVVHEPPLLTLLPDGAERVAGMDEVVAVWRREGPVPGMLRFLAAAGMGVPTPPPPPLVAAFTGMRDSIDLFLGSMLRAIVTYRPDVAALRAAPTRIVVGVGAASSGQVAHRAAVALADRLDTAPMAFPGGHGGFGEDPDGFAAVLQGALAGPA